MASRLKADVEPLIERLLSPISMSMFVHRTDMIRALLKDREEAAATLRALSDELDQVKQERDYWKLTADVERQNADFLDRLDRSLVKGDVDGR